VLPPIESDQWVDVFDSSVGADPGLTHKIFLKRDIVTNRHG
jgi:hypothetical protein